MSFHHALVAFCLALAVTIACLFYLRSKVSMFDEPWHWVPSLAVLAGYLAFETGLLANLHRIARSTETQPVEPEATPGEPNQVPGADAGNFRSTKHP